MEYRRVTLPLNSIKGYRKTHKKLSPKTIVLRRYKNEENGEVHLWFEGGGIIVSLVGPKDSVETRISTPKGSQRFGHPFASTHWTKYKKDDFGDLRRYKLSVIRMLKNHFGYDVTIK